MQNNESDSKIAHISDDAPNRPPLLKRVKNFAEWLEHHNNWKGDYEIGEVYVYIGVDPGGRNCGIVVVFSNGTYYAGTEDLWRGSSDPRACNDSMGDPVACGLHAAAVSYTPTGLFLEEFWNIHDVQDPIRIGIETVQEGPTNYWAAGLAAVLHESAGFGMDISRNPTIVPAHPKTVKWNFGLPVAGHAENKRNALEFVRQRLHLAVDDDHQADALMIALSSFFPRHRSITVPGVRPNTTKQIPEPIDQYVDRLYSIWHGPPLQTTPRATSPSAESNGKTSTASSGKSATAPGMTQSAISQPARSPTQQPTAASSAATQATNSGGIASATTTRSARRAVRRPHPYAAPQQSAQPKDSPTTASRPLDPRSPPRPRRSPRVRSLLRNTSSTSSPLSSRTYKGPPTA